VSFGFLAINDCNHGENYEMPCTYFKHTHTQSSNPLYLFLARFNTAECATTVPVRRAGLVRSW
jgi:hypothetical protein